MDTNPIVSVSAGSKPPARRGAAIAVAVIVVLAAAAWWFMRPAAPAPIVTPEPALPSDVVSEPAPAAPALTGAYQNAVASQIQAGMISLSSPTSVTVLGQAVGNWYFEASFPVEVRDQANNVIGSGIAQAQSDWMVMTLVPFVANVTLNAPYTGPATVILHKDNPSGEPQFDASVSYAVTL